MTALKKLCPNSHWEAARGTNAEASEYCKKEGDFMEWGELPAENGKKRKCEVLLEMVIEGKTDCEIMELEPSALFHQRALEAARYKFQKKEAQKWRDVNVLALWGSTGVGKTKRARELLPNAFIVHLGGKEWWDGYEGEEELIIDDYDNCVTCLRMLAILDGHPLRLPIKGGFVWALWKRVVITSNIAPEMWHSEAKYAHRVALQRRICKSSQVKNDKEADYLTF